LENRMRDSLASSAPINMTTSLYRCCSAAARAESSEASSSMSA
jgi:hypothetical protein